MQWGWGNITTLCPLFAVLYPKGGGAVPELLLGTAAIDALLLLLARGLATTGPDLLLPAAGGCTPPLPGSGAAACC